MKPSTPKPVFLKKAPQTIAAFPFSINSIKDYSNKSDNFLSYYKTPQPWLVMKNN